MVSRNQGLLMSFFRLCVCRLSNQFVDECTNIKCPASSELLIFRCSFLCWCHIECDTASLRTLFLDCARLGVLAHWMHGMCASWYRECNKEGLQARQYDVTGVLEARGSAHCALGFKPSPCPACHGHCALLHRQGAGLASLPADSLLPSCGHIQQVFSNSFLWQEWGSPVSDCFAAHDFWGLHRCKL